LLHARLVVLRGTPYKRLLDAGYTDIAECATIRECIRMVKTGIADASFGAEDTHRSAASMNGNKPPSSATAPCSAKRRLAGRLARLHRRRRAQMARRHGSPARRRHHRPHRAQIRRDGN
jgi:hypothetical protein